MLKIITTFLISALLMNSIANAEPSKPIASMMNTNVSVLDMFLFQLKDQSKCYRGWFNNETHEEKTHLCMANIEYKFDDNIIEMNFFVAENHEGMRDFDSLSQVKKEEALKKILNQIAETTGVIPYDGTQIRLGMIQMTPIRNGWSTDTFEEEEVKAELVKRTVINLRATIGGYVYLATRNQHGEIRFDKIESNFK